MQGTKYLKNAVLLTASGLVLRVMGMAFRVLIAARLGSEGMGLYQLILAMYMVFVSLASAGVNVAATRLAAQSLARGWGLGRTVRGLCTAGALFGTVAMLAQYALAAPVAHSVLHDARAELGLRILAPSLPFIAVAGALRGCFLAKRQVTPNIAAQLVEQPVRMAVALLALRGYAAWGAAWGCGAVLLGNTVSEAVSCGLMLLCAAKNPGMHSAPGDPDRPFTNRALLEIVLPVGGSRILASALQAAESSLLPMCLALYLGERTAAVAQYGAMKGMALPLIFFPFSVLAALSSLLMPEITRLHTAQDYAGTARLIRKALWLTGGFSAVAGVGLVLFGTPAARLLYGDEQVGAYVRVLGLVAPFMYLESMVDGILKGLGEQFATFRYSVLDSGIRIAGIMALVPRTGMKGFLAVMVISNLTTCLLNTARMARVLRRGDE